MKKKKLILDFDSTIVDTISSYCKTYSAIYSETIGYVEPDPTKVNQWDLKDQCGLENNPLHIFGLGYFFNKLEFMPNAKEVITKLSEKYDITVCSIGTFDNLEHKSIWLRDNLPFVDAVLIKNTGVKMNKSIVNMVGGATFIDDHADNLESSNAKTKYCFGKKYPWNEKWEGNWLNDWNEVGKVLL